MRPATLFNLVQCLLNGSISYGITRSAGDKELFIGFSDPSCNFFLSLNRERDAKVLYLSFSSFNSV